MARFKLVVPSLFLPARPPCQAQNAVLALFINLYTQFLDACGAAFTKPFSAPVLRSA